MPFSGGCDQLERLMGNMTAFPLIPLFVPVLPLPSSVSYCLSSWESFLLVHRGSAAHPLQSVREALRCKKGSWGEGLQILTQQICILGAHTEQRSSISKTCSHRGTVCGGLYGLQKQHCCEVCLPQMSVWCWGKWAQTKTFHRLQDSQCCFALYLTTHKTLLQVTGGSDRNSVYFSEFPILSYMQISLSGCLKSCLKFLQNLQGLHRETDPCSIHMDCAILMETISKYL